MAESMKEKAGIKGNDHEAGHGRETPGKLSGWSKWKTLAGALMVATAVGTAPVGCGNNDQGNTNINTSDGGCTSDGGDAACNEAGAGGDGGVVTDGGAGGDGGAVSDGGMAGDGGAVTDGGAGGDAGPVACLNSGIGQFVGTVGVAPRTVGGYVFSYEGQSGSDAVFSITCGGEAVQTDYHCPVGVTTEIDVPVDGKKISITPYSATATTTSCQIDVAAL